MYKNINDVRKISLFNRKKKREDRMIKLIGYLKLYPKQTIYDLHKHFEWPIGSIHSILKELLEDLHINFELIEENNRQKKLYSLRMEQDYIVDHYNEETLLVPINLRAAKNALKNGHQISIEMKNESTIQLSPGNDIDKFIEENNIIIELVD